MPFRCLVVLLLFVSPLAAERYRVTFDVPAVADVLAFGSPTSVEIPAVLSYDIFYGDVPNVAEGFVTMSAEGLGITASGEGYFEGSRAAPILDIAIGGEFGGQTFTEAHVMHTNSPPRVSELGRGRLQVTQPSARVFSTGNSNELSIALLRIRDAEWGDTRFEGLRVPIGDADRDNVVDFSDFLILSGNYNETGRSYFKGDFNHDNTVNFVDFLTLSGNFGDSAETLSVVAVPEPSGFLMLGLVAVGYAGWRRGKSTRA